MISLRYRKSYTIWLPGVVPLVYLALAPKDLNYLALQSLTMSVSDGGYSSKCGVRVVNTTLYIYVYII